MLSDNTDELFDISDYFLTSVSKNMVGFMTAFSKLPAF